MSCSNGVDPKKRCTITAKDAIAKAEEAGKTANNESRDGIADLSICLYFARIFVGLNLWSASCLWTIDAIRGWILDISIALSAKFNLLSGIFVVPSTT